MLTTEPNSSLFPNGTSSQFPRALGLGESAFDQSSFATFQRVFAISGDLYVALERVFWGELAGTISLHSLAPRLGDCTDGSENQGLGDGPLDVDMLVGSSRTMGRIMWDGCSLP